MRTRLQNRRKSITEPIEIIRSDGMTAVYEATIGFDAEGQPKEIFLFGAKDGTDMAAILADAAVALSVALQSGVPARAMAVSIGSSNGKRMSIIGAALDLLVNYEDAGQ